MFLFIPPISKKNTSLTRTLRAGSKPSRLTNVTNLRKTIRLVKEYLETTRDDRTDALRLGFRPLGRVFAVDGCGQGCHFGECQAVCFATFSFDGTDLGVLYVVKGRKGFGA